MYLIAVLACQPTGPSASPSPMLTAAGGALTTGGAPLCRTCAVTLDWSNVTRSDLGEPVDPSAVSSIALTAIDLPFADALTAAAEGTLTQADIAAQRGFVDLTGTTALVVDAVDWSAVAATGTVALGFTTTDNTLLSRLLATDAEGVDSVVVVDL